MGSGGGSDQHFCLRWNNFHSNIATSFEQLRDHEDFVDVTLACEGRTIKAHKVVLSACSPYFRNLLKVSGEINFRRKSPAQCRKLSLL